MFADKAVREIGMVVATAVTRAGDSRGRLTIAPRLPKPPPRELRRPAAPCDPPET
jgi:hypothetical protein